ncbi:hypothetical protein HKD37_06G016058 [Glycine soja]
MPKGSLLSEGIEKGHCTQPYPCIWKEAVSGFEPMTTSHQGTTLLLCQGLPSINITTIQYIV